jgi:hypothetical protein
MLIPNTKFLALPLVALAVIVALPKPRAEAPRPAARDVVVAAKTMADCLKAHAPAHCLVAADQSSVIR